MALHGKTHGSSGTSAYRSWSDMLSRCRNPKRRNYNRYGGRGITVCYHWLKFENFIADMGSKPPGRKISVERINNDGNYEPGNCKWATPREQAHNRERNPLYKLTNEQVEEIRLLSKTTTMTQNEIGKRFGVRQEQIHKILKGKQHAAL